MPHLRLEKEHAVNAASLSKTLRERLDISRPQMARWLGVTRQYISKLEGGVPPSKPVLLLLLKLEEESRQRPERNGQPKEPASPPERLPSPPAVGRNSGCLAAASCARCSPPGLSLFTRAGSRSRHHAAVLSRLGTAGFPTHARPGIVPPLVRSTSGHA